MLLQNVILGNLVRNNVRITCKGRVKLSVRIPSGQSHQHVGTMNLMISILAAQTSFVFCLHPSCPHVSRYMRCHF